MAAVNTLQRTPLFSRHQALGAKTIDFGGWDMPVQYSSILEEHKAVRERAGLFDVSHMGEIEIDGPEALALVNYVTTNDAAKLKDGQAQYSGLLYAHGGFVDDILVHRVREDHFFLCVNASNQDKDFAHIVTHSLDSHGRRRFQASVTFTSANYAQIAVQGPLALELVQQLCDAALADIRYYHFVDGAVAGFAARIARTGYTGEDGFELYVKPTDSSALWDLLLEKGKAYDVLPCGLGARNTLRLESAYPLYGHEIDASILPPEAGLNWIVKTAKGNFVGRDQVVEKLEEGVWRKLTGFEMVGRGIARDGYPVLADGVAAGWVTSGGPSPTLGTNIGLCYLPEEIAEEGRSIAIQIRNQPVEARIVKTPFYKREKS
ncbi:MAG: glycine cleavage system aminomethyltransferase GcvT [Bryobacterales bacterium]|nr:glycine cleavage system aminomethyltransferase GcvT [Bryobacterales bacterium]